MFKVMVVEDEEQIRNILKKMIERTVGFKVISTCDAFSSAITEFTKLRPDVVFMDIDLNGESGLECAKVITEIDPKVKIVFATAHSEYMANAFEIYAFDYLVKPFEFSELMARLRALSRRSSQKIQQDIVELGGFTLDRTSKLLMKGKQEIQLSPREFQIFDLLVQNMGIVVPREIILDRIWGIESDVSSNNIDSYVKLIRKKLDLADGKIMINTIRGVGYKLEAK